MKRSSPTLPVLSNPTACHRIADPDHVDQVRRIDCRSYDRCLDFAIEQGRRGFQCSECRGYEASAPDEKRRDMLGALRLLAETQLMLQLSQPAPVFEDETGDDDEDEDDVQAIDGGVLDDETGDDEDETGVCERARATDGCN